jgi:hypothetical protein
MLLKAFKDAKDTSNGPWAWNEAYEKRYFGTFSKYLTSKVTSYVNVARNKNKKIKRM